MSELGFQPVCVMYQGNNSPLDGTYRLVCRHQIREESFLQDDFVHVEDLTPGGSGELKQAVVMGEELVSMLLKSLYPAAAAQTSSATPMKRKRGAPSDEESNCLQQILSTVRDIKTEVLRQSHELSQIKQRQIQLETKMSLMQESIVHQVPVSKNREKKKQTKPCDKNGTTIKEHSQSLAVSQSLAIQEDILPIISNMVEVLTEDGDYDMVGEDDIVGGDDTDREDDTYTPKKKKKKRGRPMYKFIDNSHGYLAELLDNAESPSELVLGNKECSIKATQTEVEAMMSTGNTPKTFAYRLTAKCFTRTEMLEGNVKGAGRKLNGEPLNKLNPTIVHMIKEEVTKRFPIKGKEDEKMLIPTINEGINTRTRNERQMAMKRIQRQQKQEQDGGDSLS